MDEVEEINGQWRDDLRCAELVAALDRDGDEHAYDAARVVKLGIRANENTDAGRRCEAVALDCDDKVIGRFPVFGLGFRGQAVSPAFSTAAAGYAAAVDVTAVRGHDWDAGDLEYRERVVAAVLGDQYHLGVAIPW